LGAPESPYIANQAIVVRMGIQALEDLHHRAQLTETEEGRLGLSAWFAEGILVEQLLELVYIAPRYKRFVRSTAGHIRRNGFELDQTGRHAHHCTIWLPQLDDETLERLVAAFMAPELNPLYRAPVRGSRK
jgi:hypothetical protein